MIPILRSACLVLAATFALAAGAGPDTGRQAATPEHVEQRLQWVAKLIDHSSGARQIEASGNAQAQAGRASARELHRAAAEAFAAGDVAGAQRRLDQAVQAMLDGVRKAAPEPVRGAKERTDFDARLAATRALLEAQRRIAAEKGLAARDAELVRRIEALVADAQQLAARDVGAARNALDQAYLLAKASIGGMRGGDTLVRSLSFTSKEEEYRYEIDRNDTHRMLLDVLLRDGSRAAGGDATGSAVRESARLRAIAEQQAARGDFADGIGSLERSTRELVRAIRGRGIYIPG
jgi:hypothetical protein